MDKLSELNRNAIFEKLSNLPVIENTIRCNDLIDAISTAKERDKRLINNYTKEEMITMKVLVNGKIKNCRMFTELGIARYVQEGKIYSYENVCQYFEIPIKNPFDQEIKKCFEGKQFNTKKILKWLYEKRKQDKNLPELIEPKQFVIWLKQVKKSAKKSDMNQLKKQYIIDKYEF